MRSAILVVLVVLVATFARTGAANAEAPPTTRSLAPSMLEIDVGANIEAALDREVAQLLAAVAKRTLARVRRAVVIGPFVGGAGAFGFEGGSELALSFGVGITKFAIPIIPSEKAVVRSAQKRLIARVLAAGKPSEAEVRALVAEVVDEVIDELLMGLRPKRFEKPGIAGRLEGNYFVDSGAFDVRLTLALGISRVFLGTGVVLHVDDGADFVVPVELSVPMTLSRGKRSPLADFFARVDFAVTGREELVDTALFGVRLWLDII